MNLLICHDLKLFGEAMARWLGESQKENVVGVDNDPSTREEAARASKALYPGSIPCVASKISSNGFVSLRLTSQ